MIEGLAGVWSDQTEIRVHEAVLEIPLRRRFAPTIPNQPAPSGATSGNTPQKYTGNHGDSTAFWVKGRRAPLYSCWTPAACKYNGKLGETKKKQVGTYQ
jgi:hypothetical protein